MDVSRGQHKSVVFNDKLYVTGGQNRSGVLNECEMLDSATTWKKIANLNNARYLHNIFVLNDKIYVTGGIGYFEKPVMETEVYNSEKNVWEIVTKMAYPVIDGKMIVVNEVGFIDKLKNHNYEIDSDELVFVFGGYYLYDSDNLIPSDKVQYFDPDLNKWFEFTSMNTKKAGHSIDFVNGRFYVIGGLESPRIIEKYNTDKNMWETISELQIGRSYHTTVVKEDSIYIIGGRDIEEKALDNVALFNTITLQKTKEEPLSYPRYRHTSILYDDKIFVIGGIGDFSLSSIEYYNFEDKKWVSSY